MDMKFYEERALSFANKHPNLDTLFIGLSAEAGEVLSERMKENRIDRSVGNIRQDMRDELGDVLWYITAIASHYDLSLHDVAIYNLAKLKGREDGSQEEAKASL